MPNYTWYSATKDEYVEMFASIAERDTPPLEGDWVRVVEMPSFTRKTYLDGQRKDLHDFKKIAKLQRAAADMDSEDPRRKEINKEIKDRKKL